MSFCPICKVHHDPNWPCTDRTGEALRDAGIEPQHMGEEELKKTIKKADRSMIFVLIVIMALLMLTFLLSEFVSKMK